MSTATGRCVVEAQLERRIVSGLTERKPKGITGRKKKYISSTEI